MSAESVTYAALTGSAALRAYTEDTGSPSTWRIYPESAPQETLFPLVTYELVMTEPVKCLDGTSNLMRALVQVDCHALTLPVAIAMADAASAALFGNFGTFRGLQQDRTNQFDVEQRIYTVSQDFALWI
jgi:hypothetical protein